MRLLKALKARLVRVPFKLLYASDPRRRYGPLPRAMSTLRRWRILLTHPHADVRFGRGVYLGRGFELHIPNGTFIAGDGAEFRRNFFAEVTGGGRVVIGARTVFTWDATLQCSRSIEIGEDCALGHAVSVLDAQHRYEDPDRSVWEQGYEWHPITIEPGCWIGQKCTIMASVGRRAVIGANSVVTRDIPAYTVAAGAPARPLKSFGPAEPQPTELPT